MPINLNKGPAPLKTDRQELWTPAYAEFMKWVTQVFAVTIFAIILVNIVSFAILIVVSIWRGIL